MRKGIFIGLFTLCFGVTGFSQTQVPPAVTSAFNQAMPNANATFVQQGNEWRANYTENGTQMAYIYTPEGDFQGLEVGITKNEIPSPALQDINARFGNFPFEGAAKRTLADGSLQYKYQYQDGNNHVYVIYSPNGQIIKRNIYQ